MERGEASAEYHFQQLQAVITARLAGAKDLEAEANAKSDDAKAYTLRLQDKESQLKKREAQQLRRERNWEAQRGKEESDLQAQKDEIDAKLKLSDASQTALQEQRQKAHIQLKELKSAGEYLESLLQEFATQAEQIRHDNECNATSENEQRSSIAEEAEHVLENDEELPSSAEESPRSFDQTTNIQEESPQDLEDAKAADWLFGEQLKSELGSENAAEDILQNRAHLETPDANESCKRTATPAKLNQARETEPSESVRHQKSVPRGSLHKAAEHTSESVPSVVVESQAHASNVDQGIDSRSASQAPPTNCRPSLSACEPNAKPHHTRVQNQQSREPSVLRTQETEQQEREKKVIKNHSRLSGTEAADGSKAREEHSPEPVNIPAKEQNQAADNVEMLHREESWSFEKPNGDVFESDTEVSPSVDARKSEDWTNPPAWESEDSEEMIPLAKRRKMLVEESTDADSKATLDLTKEAERTTSVATANPSKVSDGQATQNTRNTQEVPKAKRRSSWDDILRRSQSPQIPSSNLVSSHGHESSQKQQMASESANKTTENFSTAAHNQENGKSTSGISAEEAKEREIRRKKDQKNAKRREARAVAKLKGLENDKPAQPPLTSRNSPSLSGRKAECMPDSSRPSDHHTANGTEDLENIDPQIEEFISVDVNVPQNTKSFSSGQEKDYWDLELETKTSEGAVSDGGTCQNGIEQNGNTTKSQRMGSGDIGLPMPPHIKLPMPPPIKSEHRTSLQQPEDPRRAVSPRRYGDDSHEHHRGRRKRGPSLLSREARPGSEIPLAVPHMENGGQREILIPTVYPPKIRPPAPANFHMPVPIRGKPNTRGRGRASNYRTEKNLNAAVDELRAVFSDSA